MIKIQLPDTFGTGTIHGMFYKMMNLPNLSSKEETSKVVSSALEQEIFLVLPKLIDLETFTLIADEANSFAKWASFHFSKTPKLTFV